MNYLKSSFNWLLDRQNYRKIYLFFALLYFMPSTLDVEYYILWGVLLWGVVIVVNDFFTERLMFKMKYWYILVAFLASYAISILLNFNEELIRGIYNWTYLAITLLVIYPTDKDVDIKKIKNELLSFNNILIGVTLIASLISIGMFIFQVSYRVPVGAIEARQGFMESRLFGIYTSPNIGSIFGYLSIIASIINNLIVRKKWFKFSYIYILNLVIQYLYFLLSSSRGSFLTISTFIVLFTIFVVTPNTLKLKNKQFKSIIVNIGIIGASLFMLSGFSGAIQEGLSYIPSTIDNIQNSLDNPIQNEDDQINDDFIEETNDLERSVDRVKIEHSPDEAEISSGRMTIWEAALTVVKQFPFFGTADANYYRGGLESTSHINETILTTQNVNELKRARGNMHNVYVQVLIMSGFVGFVIISSFFILVLKDNILFLFNYSFQNQAMRNMLLIILIFIISLFVEDLVETHILFNVKDVVAIVFWYYLGLLEYFRRNSYDKKGI